MEDARRQAAGALDIDGGARERVEAVADAQGAELVDGIVGEIVDGATWERAGRISRAPMDSSAADRLAPALFFDGSAIDFSSALLNTSGG